MNPIEKTVRKVDAAQQRHTFLSFPMAVVKKFGDDQAGYLAALIAYYGFFSLFPLMLVFVSVLGILLRGNPDLQQSIVNSALRDFPVIGDQISKNIHAISGNGFALAVGILGTLWAGLGVTQAAQNAMNRIWDVPRKDWPNFLFSRLRGLGMLAILGTITVGATFLSGFSSSGSANSLLLAIAGIAGSLVLNFLLFFLSFMVLTVKNVGWRDVVPGSIVAAVLWTLLQALGEYYLTHQIKNASEVYGTFALVIGLLVWIYLGAQLTLYCAEINVVRARRLWPRSLVQPPLTPADEHVLTALVQAEVQRPEETAEVSFDRPSPETRGVAPAAAPPQAEHASTQPDKVQHPRDEPRAVEDGGSPTASFMVRPALSALPSADGNGDRRSPGGDRGSAVAKAAGVGGAALLAAGAFIAVRRARKGSA
jgi:membrane protein